jgi:arsenate reductase
MAEEVSEKPRVRVLFLCVHNAARSQMAEALLRRLAPDSCDVESAGFEPRPVLPEAVRAMSLLGIDISGVRSKAVFDLYRDGRIFDFVVTVCDEATAERCPIFPGVCERLHWNFADPSAAEGSDAERLQQVVQIRDEIKLRIEAWLAAKQTTGLLPRLGTSHQDPRKG